MAIDLTSSDVIDWLSQFDLADQPAASLLLTSIQTVSADEFTAGLTTALNVFKAANNGPIALYSERHIRRWRGEPNRLFKETRTKHRRAFGDGPAPVPAGHAARRETGSEGLIATLITGWVRDDENRLFDHPGPDLIREHKIRHHVVVTDFIGSGKRIRDNLDSVWRLRSSRSWHSYGLMSYGVLAFSGTVQGIETVERHRTRPVIQLHQGCPTLGHLPAGDQYMIEQLLSRNGPHPRVEYKTPLGYQNGGTLILFDHGIPNNAPLILHEKTKTWTPLFPKRSAVSQRLQQVRGERLEDIQKALAQLREKRLAASPRLAGLAMDEQNRVLILACLKRRPRIPLVVSARTNIPLQLVEAIISQAQNDGLVDGCLKLTDKAYLAFDYLRRKDVEKPPLAKTNESFYCPSRLRPPRRTV